MSIRDFDVLEKLGEGAFSQVFRVRRKTDGEVYALKKVKMLGLKERERENALNEVRILASVTHPNIIAYKEAFIESSSNTLWYSSHSIVMEHADGGDLLQQINTHKRKGTTYPEPLVWTIFVQMIKGLKALHDMKILHRDLKCANVFVCRDGTIKLGDMNVSKVAKCGMVYTQTGTPYYASPEVWRDQPYDSKSDVWSVGCVLYELITLQPPFQASDMQGLYKKVIRGQYPEIPRAYSQDLGSMVHTLLQVNPALRPSCDRLMSMPILLRNTVIPFTGDTQRDPQGLLGTIKLPRNLSALSDRLPAPNYQKKTRNNSQPFSVKHEHEKPPLQQRDSLVNRGREVMQVPGQREGRSLSASRPDAVPAHRNLSSDVRQSPVVRDIYRTPSREHLRLPPSPRKMYSQNIILEDWCIPLILRYSEEKARLDMTSRRLISLLSNANAPLLREAKIRVDITDRVLIV